MKYFGIIVFSVLVVNCSTESNKNNCLNNSLIEKLEVFKTELIDSLSVTTNTLYLKLLIEKSITKENILLNYIDFSSEEIQSVKTCLCNEKTYFSDSSMIDILVNLTVPVNLINLNELLSADEPNEYLNLFWLYHLIKKEHISCSIDVLDKNTFVLNGDTLTDFTEIRKRVLQNKSLSSDKQKSRSIISIRADKDDVDMETIDRVENELREANALRINYSTN